jgi:hypothetical protein
LLLSTSHRFVFVHVGKNGGNAISAALKPFASEGYWNGDSPQKHWPAFKIRDELLLETWNDYFSFGFVSNPWRWLHSSYHYIVMTSLLYSSERLAPALSPWKQWTVRDPDEYTKKWIAEATENAKKSFETFVVGECEDFTARFPGGQIRKWFQDKDGSDLVRFVGNYDRLSDEWPFLCSKLGIDLIPLPKTNPTLLRDGRPRSQINYRNDYTPQMRERVHKAFFLDIQRMGYEF